jgi:predicted transcriptional regulator
VNVVIDPKRWFGVIKGERVNLLKTLGPREIKIFIALAFIADTQGKVITSMGELAWQSGLCKITIRRALLTLHRLGVVWVEEQGFGPGAATIVHIAKRFAKVEE